MSQNPSWQLFFGLMALPVLYLLSSQLPVLKSPLTEIISPQLEELWHVVEEGEDDDGCDVAPRGPLVTHVVERLAHGQVPLHRHRHREVDAARQTDLRGSRRF